VDVIFLHGLCSDMSGYALWCRRLAWLCCMAAQVYMAVGQHQGHS
jgi:hypothetical protein